MQNKAALHLLHTGVLFCTGIVPLSFLYAPAHAQDIDDGLLSSQTLPNFIVIVVDDLRWDELGIEDHPYLETPNIDRLAVEGVRFQNAFHLTPLCSPNRASILTGQYPSRHGIIDNVARNVASHGLLTFPQVLQRAGYETAFVGKWHMGNDPTPRPGFDHWAGLPGQGRTTDPELYEDGALTVIEGYVTDILTERALSVIDQMRQRPFMLYLGHKAVHPDIIQRDDGSADPSSTGFNPAPRHRGRYAEDVFPRRENVVVSLDQLSGKPALLRALTLKNSEEMIEAHGFLPDFYTTEDLIRRRAEMMLAVDEGLGQILDALERWEILDRTAILFTSDNGYWYDEHGLADERRLPYEEGIRMPLLIRYPIAVPAGINPEELVSSVDIAPTILELAGVTADSQMQGRSLVPLLSGSSGNWRDACVDRVLLPRQFEAMAGRHGLSGGSDRSLQTDSLDSTSR